MQNANTSLVSGEILFPDPELKTQKVDCKGGIDWYIYWERILTPHVYPFTKEVIAEFLEGNIMIIEDNAPAHADHYHDMSQEWLGFANMI